MAAYSSVFKRVEKKYRIGAAELPRAYVDVRLPDTPGRTIRVAAGGDLWR